MLLEAIRTCSKFEKIPDMEISLTISKWMAQATNRTTKKNKEKL